MAIWYLINTTNVGTNRIVAGTRIDDAQEDAASLRAAGGLLVSSSYATVVAAAAIAQSMRARGDDQEKIDAVMSASLESQQELEILTPVADSTALAAIPVAGRADGSTCTKLDDSTSWIFAAGSSEAASSTCIVPAAGTGRWVYNGPRWGVPMQNRLRLLGAPGAAVAGDTVVIAGVTFEFRAVTPPAGGTAGRIWVYNGATSATSRAALIKAINGTVDAANVTYNGVTPPNFKAFAGVTTGDIQIVSSATPGGAAVPSATASACSETLTTAADIWDNATCRSGVLPTPPHMEAATASLGAADIAKGTIEIQFTFAPRCVYLWNRNRAQNEAYVITGNAVSLTLAGGGSPNNQAADVIDVLAFS